MSTSRIKNQVSTICQAWNTNLGLSSVYIKEAQEKSIEEGLIPLDSEVIKRARVTAR